jgi:hypothetical protein
LLPGASYVVTSAISSVPIEKKQELRYNSASGILGTNTIQVQRSFYTHTAQRHYLKVLDALSYVGGIIPGLFILFSFLKPYAFYFFEMNLAEKHFKCSEAKQHNFAQFFKYIIHRGLSMFGCQIKSWKGA